MNEGEISPEKRQMMVVGKKKKKTEWAEDQRRRTWPRRLDILEASSHDR